MWVLKPEPVHHDVSQAGRHDAGALPLITHFFSIVVLTLRSSFVGGVAITPEESRITRFSGKLSGLCSSKLLMKNSGGAYEIR